MKALRILIIPVFIFVSCSGNNEYFQVISDEALHYHLLLGLLVENNDSKYIVMISNTDLYNSIYKPEFKNLYRTFSDFIKKVLSQELNLYSTLHEHNFPLVSYDSNILVETELRKIKKKYFNQSDNRLLFKASVPHRTKYHLIEYMTTKEYFIIFDDYSGEYVFFKSFDYMRLKPTRANFQSVRIKTIDPAS